MKNLYKNLLNLAKLCERDEDIKSAGEYNDKAYEISYEQYRIAYDTYEILKNSKNQEIQKSVSKLKQIIETFERTNGQFILKQVKGEIPSLNQKPL